MERPHDEPKHYLVGRIREALAEDPRVNELNVEATVAAGKIFLTGIVATAQRREAISEVVRELLPGYDIYNETTVEAISETDEMENLS
jgi:hypothetical protein